MQEHEQWLQIARDDLKMAKLALSQDLFAPLSYHCQQTAEKVLKGYLVFKNQPILKIHDLSKLLEICLKFDAGFEKFRKSASILSPLATKFRYPSEYDIPDRNDAELAIKHAEDILKFVLRKFSETETGQKSIF